MHDLPPTSSGVLCHGFCSTERKIRGPGLVTKLPGPELQLNDLRELHEQGQRSREDA